MTQKAFDEMLIGYFLEYLFLLLLIWGISIQIARIAGLNLLNSGLLGSFNMIVGTIFWVYYVSKRFVYNRKETTALLILVFFCCCIAYLRSNFLVYGADAFHYLARVSYLLFDPNQSLTFDIPGHFPKSTSIMDGYWIPYTFEYFLGYISLITGVPLSVLSFKVMPAFAAFLVPLPIYGIFRSFSIRPLPSVGFVILSLVVLFFDSNNLNTIGGMSFLRVFENKGLLIGIGLPTLWFFTLTIFFSEKIGKLEYFRIFCISSALCFLSANAIYLIAISEILLLSAMLITKWVTKDRSLPQDYMLLVILISSLFTPLIIWICLGFFDRNTYELASIVWAIYDRDVLSFADMWNKVFGSFTWFDAAIFISLWAISLYIGLTEKDKRFILLVAWPVLYVVFIINPAIFFMAKKTSAKFISYFRFYYVFPLLIFPFIMLATIGSLGRKLTISIVACLVLLFLCANVYNKFDETKSFLEQNNNTTQEFSSGFEPITHYSKLGIIERGEYILANRRDASEMAFFTAGARQLVIHGYFLLSRATSDEEMDEYEKIIKAQDFINRRHSPYKKEFLDVVRKYSPRIIIPKLSLKNKIEKTLTGTRYSLHETKYGKPMFIKDGE